jgi:hypothetical protein
VIDEDRQEFIEYAAEHIFKSGPNKFIENLRVCFAVLRRAFPLETTLSVMKEILKRMNEKVEAKAGVPLFESFEVGAVEFYSPVCEDCEDHNCSNCPVLDELDELDLAGPEDKSKLH